MKTLDQLHDFLDEVPDNRTLTEVCSDLKELELDPDAILSRLELKVQAVLKEDRLSWQVDAATNKSAFRKLKEGVTSWLTESDEAIEKAYQELLTAPATAFAFRNKAGLTIQDKARLLDTMTRLKPVTTDHGAE